jgi:integrase
VPHFDALAVMKADQLRGTWIDHRSATITLCAYSEQWMEARRIKETTKDKYQGLLGRHILPKFGSIELGRITTQSIRSWNTKLSSVHPDTAAQAYRLLATIFNTAVDDNLLARSPCRVKGASYFHNPERPVATLEEIAGAVSATEEQYRLSIILAVWCHLRPQEVLGLQRRHVDITNATLTVQQTLTMSNGKMIKGGPKTQAGGRTFHIPENAVPYLVDHLSRFVGSGTDSWLFQGPTGDNVTTRTLQRHWDKARRAIGRPELRLYDMRHTGLTLVASSGASLAELMRRGGHSSPAAALRYQHATDGRDKLLADGLATLADGLPQPSEKKMGHARGTETSGAPTEETQSTAQYSLPVERETFDGPTPAVPILPVLPAQGVEMLVQLDREITSFLTDADTRALDKFLRGVHVWPDLDQQGLISPSPTG